MPTAEATTSNCLLFTAGSRPEKSIATKSGLRSSFLAAAEMRSISKPVSLPFSAYAYGLMLFDVPIFSVPALATPSLFDLPLAELQAVSARASAQRSPSTRAAYDLVMDAPGGSDGRFGRTFSGRCGERSHPVGTFVKTLHPSFLPALPGAIACAAGEISAQPPRVSLNG